MGDTMENNKLCSLWDGSQATYVCCICNLLQHISLNECCTAMNLEENRDRKCKGKEFHQIHSFWLMPRRLSSVIHSNLKRWWRWDVIPALKIFSMIWYFVIHWEYIFQHLLKLCMLFCLVMVPICWMLFKDWKRDRKRIKRRKDEKRKRKWSRTVKMKKRKKRKKSQQKEEKEFFFY